MLQMDQSSGSALTFRRAAASDAAALAPLVLASGRQEFDWLLGVPPAACEAFLRRAIATPSVSGLLRAPLAAAGGIR
ncbi:acetyltransferase domain protein [Ralstonia pickettii]|nr:acetyltransferase domain protein [Ralstonia pickettii]